MRELTSFDHVAIASEMKSLVGRHFQKLSTIPGGYKLKLRGKDILIILPDKVYPTSYSVPSLSPDRIATRARKVISGRLESVEVLNLDRVVRFRFTQGSIILELFRQGNVVLMEGNIIVDVLHPGSWRHRELKPRIPYTPPPSPPISRGELLEGPAEAALVRSGVPKPYAREVIYQLGIEPTDPLPVEEALEVVKSILEGLKKPAGYLCRGEPYPISLSYVENCERVSDSFASVLDFFTPSLFSSEQPEKKKKPSKIDYMLQSLKELDKKIDSLEKLLNYVYEHWAEVERALSTGDFSSLSFRIKGREGRKIRLEFTP